MNYQSERLFRPLIENSPDAVILVNEKSEITYANQAAIRLMGESSQSVAKLSLLSFIHPDDRDDFLKLLGLPQAESEIRLRDPENDWRTYRISLANLRDDPDIKGHLINLKDISEDKERERILKSQRDFLQNLVVVARATNEAAELEEMLSNLVRIGKWMTEAAAGTVFLFDQVGTLAYTKSYHGRLDSSRVQRLTKSGLTGWIVSNNKPALIIDTLQDERWLNLPTSNSYVPRSALGIPIVDGPTLLAILILTHSQPGHFNPNHLKTLEGASGQMAMAMKNARLYSDAQSNLADLKSLIAASQDGIVFVNPDGHIRVINSAALQLSGLPGNPSDWVGINSIEMFHQARRSAPALIKIMVRETRRILSGDHRGTEGEVMTASHDIMWENMPVTASGRIIGRLLILRDITKQRKLERQREELTNMIVHDLRNPVSAISGIVAMLKSVSTVEELPSDFDQMILLAERNVSKILDLLQEILDVSQLENDHLPIENTPISVEQIITDILQLQSSIVLLKNIELMTNIEPGLPEIQADKRLIQRVLQNLVDNAAKFSSRNSSILVSAQLSEIFPEQLQISVQDQGAGIPAELKGRVFDKFVTGGHAERGSGLGLTFCRLAVHAHGGQIWAESEEGQGSTFHFTLPLVPEIETDNNI